MRHLIPFLVLMLAFVPSAGAAPCKTQGALDARELSFDLKDQKLLEGLLLSLEFGLTPKSFPEDDIAAMKTPCSRGDFPFVNGMTMELRGEDDDMPPRWAVSPLPGPTVYVAAMPRPAAALRNAAIAKAGGVASFEPGDMMYAVVLTRGDDKRHVFHFFDNIPDDTRLKALLRPIVISQGKELVCFDMTADTIAVEAK